MELAEFKGLVTRSYFNFNANPLVNIFTTGLSLFNIYIYFFRNSHFWINIYIYIYWHTCNESKKLKVFQSIFDATRKWLLLLWNSYRITLSNRKLVFTFQFLYFKRFQCFWNIFFPYMNIWNKLSLKIESLTMIGQASNFCNDEIRYVALREANNSWIRVSVRFLVVNPRLLESRTESTSLWWMLTELLQILVRDHHAHEFHREKAIKSLKGK